MDDIYFSEHEHGLPLQNKEEINNKFWNGLIGYIQIKINDGSFSDHFPKNCPDIDKIVPIGCDIKAIMQMIEAEFATIKWPLNSKNTPNTLDILDLIEFFFRYMSKPDLKEYHQFYQHNHYLSFNKLEGQVEYCNYINRLFRRNNLAYELQRDGNIIRIGPMVLRETLMVMHFYSEDKELNRLLEDARKKFLDPDVNIRREAVEKLWDVWERIKTLEPGSDKREQICALFKKAITNEKLRKYINMDAKELTEIGNNFTIRHTETDKTIISESNYFDYLFHRLFALIQLLLRQTNRGG
jgi:hypothetical protein